MVGPNAHGFLGLWSLSPRHRFHDDERLVILRDRSPTQRLDELRPEHFGRPQIKLACEGHEPITTEFLAILICRFGHAVCVQHDQVADGWFHDHPIVGDIG